MKIDYKNTVSYKLLMQRQEIYNDILLGKRVEIEKFALWMRLNPTLAEKNMYNILKNTGIRFNKQYVFKPYILDFFSRKYLLVIKIDGPHHNKEYDKNRDDFLIKNNLTVLHFTVSDLYYTPELVEEKILKQIEILKNKRENKTLF